MLTEEQRTLLNVIWLGKFREGLIDSSLEHKATFELGFEAGFNCAVSALKDSEANEVLARLSPAERKVAECICKGMSNKVIAKELGVSPPTVKNHAQNAYKKAGVQTRSGLVAAILTSKHPLLRDVNESL